MVVWHVKKEKGGRLYSLPIIPCYYVGTKLPKFLGLGVWSRRRCSERQPGNGGRARWQRSPFRNFGGAGNRANVGENKNATAALFSCFLHLLIQGSGARNIELHGLPQKNRVLRARQDNASYSPHRRGFMTVLFPNCPRSLHPRCIL